LLVDHVHVLREAIQKVRRSHPFHIDAIVVLPEHLHCIWTLPPGDVDYSMRWRQIKSAFSVSLPKTESRSASRRRSGERGIWQRRFWEHTLRDEGDFGRHVDYVHFNPVKHGYVKRAIDWPWSSIHRFVKRKILSEDWSAEPEVDMDLG
jgi:putative transposase